MSSGTVQLITHDSPVGRLTMAASDVGLTRVSTRPARATSGMPGSPAASRLLDQARRELDEYFAGERQAFDVPVDLSRVEPHSRAILSHLTSQVGYGRTTTYGAIAATLALGSDGPREVGAAMARNPVWIVLPCHRVLGAGGKLTGYAGGLAVKRWLLDLESRGQFPQLDLAAGESDVGGLQLLGLAADR
jgi:methylated-DNA-[protein]-cysteine S-methyltransferase